MLCECVSLEKWVECEGGQDFGEEEEKYGGQQREKWECKSEGLRGTRES